MKKHFLRLSLYVVFALLALSLNSCDNKDNTTSSENNGTGRSGWTIQSSGVTNNLFCVSFVNSSFGMVVGENGRVLKTTNSGINWTVIHENSKYWLKSIKCIDENNAVAVGYNGTVIKTTDGGNTWFDQLTTVTNQLNAVTFIGPDIGYIAGYAGSVFMTSNGGTNWINEIQVQTSIYGMCFADYVYGVLCGSGGLIYRTWDGGYNWVSAPSGTGVDLNSIAFINANTGVVVGNAGEIRMSVDGGQGWYKAGTSPTTNTLFSVSMPLIGRITAVGGSGTVVSSTDWGGTWHYQYTDFKGILYGVCFTDANFGVAVGESGLIMTTTNGGENW